MASREIVSLRRAAELSCRSAGLRPTSARNVLQIVTQFDWSNMEASEKSPFSGVLLKSLLTVLFATVMSRPPVRTSSTYILLNQFGVRSSRRPRVRMAGQDPVARGKPERFLPRRTLGLRTTNCRCVGHPKRLPCPAFGGRPSETLVGYISELCWYLVPLKSGAT